MPASAKKVAASDTFTDCSCLYAGHAVSIFIVPPSAEELERRIRARGQDSAEEIDRRLKRARHEMESFGLYDFIVVNDDLERAGREVHAIGLGTRCRSSRARPVVERILKTFGG